MPATLSPRAERLKEEANGLYRAKKIKAALKLYSEAIDEAPDNAVLYSNRCACHLALDDLHLAEGDAKKATELDPTFLRGWLRLATVCEVRTAFSPAPCSCADMRAAAQ